MLHSETDKKTGNYFEPEDVTREIILLKAEK